MNGMPITDEQVAAFLEADPGFFARHADLLAGLRIPHPSGDAVSLVERQVAVLRERNVELRERLDSLLSIARDNDQLFGQTRQLVLALVEANTLAALAQTLLRALVEDFGMSAATLTLPDARLDAVIPGVRHPASAELDPRIAALMRTARVLCGGLHDDEKAYFFGPDAGAVGSAAIVPLEFHGMHGVLAIGARDPKHFRSGMDTLFVGHLGDVLARRLHALLAGGESAGRTQRGG